MLSMSIVGHEDTFEISPKVINQRGQFIISLKNSKKLDYEQTKMFEFKVIIFKVFPGPPLCLSIQFWYLFPWSALTLRLFFHQIEAKELGPNQLSATAGVTVHLIDTNDNKPTFDLFKKGGDHYEAYVHEQAAPGTKILQVNRKLGQPDLWGW